MPATPFTNPRLLAPLYATAGRVAQRTSALHAAKISSEDATATITELAARVTLGHPTVCDIGCGRGTASLALARRLNPRRMIALDQSPALLNVVRQRAAQSGLAVETVCADFHRLPLPSTSIDVAVAAFCLYHSARPEQVVGEIAKSLIEGRHAVIVTKSVDSYREIDRLIAESGLDPHAKSRPSLYNSFHSTNAPEIIATALHIEQVTHQHHVFRFSGLDHLAVYLATSPKYQLPEHLGSDAATLATELRRRIPDKPITATSTISYVTATRR